MKGETLYKAKDCGCVCAVQPKQQKQYDCDSQSYFLTNLYYILKKSPECSIRIHKHHATDAELGKKFTKLKDEHLSIVETLYL